MVEGDDGVAGGELVYESQAQPRETRPRYRLRDRAGEGNRRDARYGRKVRR